MNDRLIAAHLTELVVQLKRIAHATETLAKQADPEFKPAYSEKDREKPRSRTPTERGE